jgi:hypothetical protein
MRIVYCLHSQRLLDRNSGPAALNQAAKSNTVNKSWCVEPLRSIMGLSAAFLLVMGPAHAQTVFSLNPAARTCEVAFKDNTVETKPCSGSLPVPTCANPNVKVPVSIKMIDEFGLAHVKTFPAPPTPQNCTPCVLPAAFDANVIPATGAASIPMPCPARTYRVTQSVVKYEDMDNIGWRHNDGPWPAADSTYDITVAADQSLSLYRITKITPSLVQLGTPSTDYYVNVNYNRVEDELWAVRRPISQANLPVVPDAYGRYPVGTEFFPVYTKDRKDGSCTPGPGYTEIWCRDGGYRWFVFQSRTSTGSIAPLP